MSKTNNDFILKIISIYGHHQMSVMVYDSMLIWILHLTVSHKEGYPPPNVLGITLN